MRVLAVAAESSIAAALNMMEGWEVVFEHEAGRVEGAAREAGVVIVGGGTDSGLALIQELRERGVAAPAVVLGDVPPPEGAEVTVVVPPFTLDELRLAVEAAVRLGRSARGGTREILADVPSPVRTPDEELPDPGPPPPAMPDTTQFREPTTPPTAAPETEEEPALMVVETSPPSIPDVREPQSLAPVTALPQREPIRHPSSPAATAPAEQPRRWGRRRAQREEAAPQADTEMPMAERLRIAELAARELEGVVRKLPVLVDLHALAAALVGEVVERFAPEIAVLYVPGPNGFRVAAAEGLTSSERRMVVNADQPLFSKIWSSREAHLVAPLDLARGLVTGIGGARTEALIAGPVEAEGGCVGIIVVGGPDFTDGDLDKLDALAREAAPGLAVAQTIERLRNGDY